MDQRPPFRALAVAALLFGAAGIAVLWAAGVEFPVAVPPGIVILGVGAVVVARSHRRWTALVATGLGVFVLAGFLLSPTGIDNITGEEGVLVAAGQAIQVLGVTAAAVLGLVTYLAEGRGDRDGDATDARQAPA